MSTESIHRQTVDEHGFFRLIVSLPVHGRSQSWSLTVIRTVGETKESPQVILGLATCVRAAPVHVRYGKTKSIHPGLLAPNGEDGTDWET